MTARVYRPPTVHQTLFKKIFIYGCAGSSLLPGLFSLLLSGGAWASHSCGFSCCRAQALACMGLSHCGSRAPEHRPQQLWRMGLAALRPVGSPGIEPMSPTSAGRFFATELPGKPCLILLVIPPSAVSSALSALYR